MFHVILAEPMLRLLFLCCVLNLSLPIKNKQTKKPQTLEAPSMLLLHDVIGWEERKSFREAEMDVVLPLLIKMSQRSLAGRLWAPGTFQKAPK